MKTIANQMPTRGAWNKTHGTNWEEALVSGNGRHGVMVFGNPKQETIIGNHCRLYLPTGAGEVLPDMSHYLDEFRQMIKVKGYQPAIDVYYQKARELGYKGLEMSDPFHPGFHMHMITEADAIHNYTRSVNFETGEVAVRFTDEKNRAYTRKTFVSQEDDVIVLLVENDQMDVSCTFEIEDYQHELIDHKRELDENYVRLYNKYVIGTGGYQVAIRIEAKGGTVAVYDQKISVSHADSLLLIMKIVPYKTESDKNMEQLIEELESLPMNYSTLFERHRVIHQDMFHRVSLKLANDEQRKKATEDLFEEAKLESKLPPALLEKMYDAGRYMFICSAGELTPNLQGIWTGTFTPAWSGDFTFDTNVQLAIAHALSCGLMEGLNGYFRLIDELLPAFRENAMNIYGARGILSAAHASTSGRHFHWNAEWPLHLWTCGAGWLGHWYYQYYLITGDKQFLKEKAIPYLRECVDFYEDFLIEDEDGTYRFTPSYSAENGCADNATQDIAVAKEVLTNLITSYKELGLDSVEVEKWKTMLSKLPPYLINEEGALQEWAVEGMEENYNHRHFSHLYSIFQSREFTSKSEPELWHASEVAFNKRLDAWLRSEDGDTSSTHGRMHTGLTATQFNNRELAYEVLKMMVMKDSMFPSMITSHYNDRHLFNVDGNGAIPQIMNEMIIDSVPGEIVLLRALPEEIQVGSLEGVFLRKQIIANLIKWDLENRGLELILTSSIDQDVQISLPHFNIFSVDADGCVVEENKHLIEDRHAVQVRLQANRHASVVLNI